MKRAQHVVALVAVALLIGAAACSKDKEPAPAPDKDKAPVEDPGKRKVGEPGAARPKAEPLPPPPDVAAPPADAEKTPSGLASKILQPGTGTDKPQEQDRVKVHYTGWTTDGKMFDSSV